MWKEAIHDLGNAAGKYRRESDDTKMGYPRKSESLFRQRKWQIMEEKYECEGGIVTTYGAMSTGICWRN